MRVIECNDCGDLLGAANDDELAACLVRHLSREHGRDTSHEDATAVIADRAYEASDS